MRRLQCLPRKRPRPPLRSVGRAFPLRRRHTVPCQSLLHACLLRAFRSSSRLHRMPYLYQVHALRQAQCLSACRLSVCVCRFGSSNTHVERDYRQTSCQAMKSSHIPLSPYGHFPASRLHGRCMLCCRPRLFVDVPSVVAFPVLQSVPVRRSSSFRWTHASANLGISSTMRLQIPCAVLRQRQDTLFLHC